MGELAGKILPYLAAKPSLLSRIEEHLSESGVKNNEPVRSRVNIKKEIKPETGFSTSAAL